MDAARTGEQALGGTPERRKERKGWSRAGRCNLCASQVWKKTRNTDTLTDATEYRCANEECARHKPF